MDELDPDASLLWCMIYANICGIMFHPGYCDEEREGGEPRMNFHEAARLSDAAVGEFLKRRKPAFRCVCGEMHRLGDGHVCKPRERAPSST